MAESLMRNFKKSEPQLEEQKITPAQAIKCKAHACPLNGSVSETGEGWLCPYHAKASGRASPKVTQMINENYRLIQIEKTINKLRADEYDDLIKRGGIELHELMKPVEGEKHPQWQHRLRQMIHRTLLKKTNQIVEQDELDRQGSSRDVSRAVRDLTSGILRPDQRVSA